ncbi:MAG: hypothetical protein E6040_08100 [Lachnospiraceae bacterium]|jgi:hypothetical protein|nr:hypothetical protein [Lachnospiraceae bacterium]
MERKEKIEVPEVFDDNNDDSKFVLIERTTLDQLVECSEKIETARVIFERVTIGVAVLVAGVLIGMLWL